MMTVSYADAHVSLVMLLWKGSLYKVVFKDVIVFFMLYYTIFITHMWFTEEPGKIHMHHLIETFDKGASYIPLDFLLGFYVSAVVARWWEQLKLVSWPDKFMIVCNMNLSGWENLQIRHTLARLSTLQAALVWRTVSKRVFKRFPTEKHLAETGLMTKEEYHLYQSIDAPYGKWFIPTIWMSNLVKKCHDEKRIDSVQLKMIGEELIKYRDGFGMLLKYDWVSLPLVYTQIVSIATYGYMGLCLIARQPFLDMEAKPATSIVMATPLFTSLQLIFYVGWLNVGRCLANPFGDDDDDFEMNWILDRNHHVAHLMADMDLSMPKVDAYFDDSYRFVPYTVESAKKQDVPPNDKFKDYQIKREQMAVVKKKFSSGPF